MTPDKIKQLITLGEGVSVKFKSPDARPDSLAREMVALSNTYGGILLLGVEDNGTISGVLPHHLEEKIANICRHNVVPAIAPLISLILVDDFTICAIRSQREHISHIKHRTVSSGSGSGLPTDKQQRKS